jgi:hypothetical protein
MVLLAHCNDVKLSKHNNDYYSLIDFFSLILSAPLCLSVLVALIFSLVLRAGGFSEVAEAG